MRFSKRQENPNHVLSVPLPVSWDSYSGEASRGRQATDVEVRTSVYIDLLLSSQTTPLSWLKRLHLMMLNRL